MASVGETQIRDAQSGDLVRTLESADDSRVSAVDFSPDGTQLATASEKQVRLWNLESGEPVATLSGRGDISVGAVAFSPDGALLGYVSFDGTVALTSVASLEEFGEPLTRDTRAYSLTFSESGDRIFVATDEGIAVWQGIWDVDLACRLATPYLSLADIESVLPAGVVPNACKYA